jgi:hypothetical protein
MLERILLDMLLRDRENFERLKAEGRFYMRIKKEPGYGGPVYMRPPAKGEDA